MTLRLDYRAVAPDALKPLLAMEKYLHGSSISQTLRGLVKLRASQINGCAYCVAMHSRELRELGEEDRRIDLLSVWREADIYDDRERAALDWTEEVTMLADGGATEDLLDALRDEFDDHEIVDLNMTVIAINAWNRLAVPFGYESSAAPSH
jgi:uncharacterized peroxidase-related enzyme